MWMSGMNRIRNGDQFQLSWLHMCVWVGRSSRLCSRKHKVTGKLKDFIAPGKGYYNGWGLL